LAEIAEGAAVAEEDQLRATWYSILGWVLSDAPGKEGLRRLAGLEGDSSEFGDAVRALAATAEASSEKAVRQEYFDLFIGVGRGELVPFGSYYLTGFLHEKPLARLRGDMAALGIERAGGVSEPEDHIATLCEVMSGLITGAHGQPASLAEQRRFFETHIGCWAPRFFEDLEGAEAAVLYRPVGTIGRLFLAVESTGFEMAA
jgi:TorA maturation chaperone TorD